MRVVTPHGAGALNAALSEEGMAATDGPVRAGWISGGQPVRGPQARGSGTPAVER